VATSRTACYAPPLIGRGIKRWYCLTSVCLSVAYIGPKSRTERPSKIKTKFGTEVAHVICDPDTTFKVKRSRSPGRFGWLFKSLHNVYGRHHILRHRPERAAGVDLVAYCGGLPPTACYCKCRKLPRLTLSGQTSRQEASVADRQNLAADRPWAVRRWLVHECVGTVSQHGTEADRPTSVWTEPRVCGGRSCHLLRLHGVRHHVVCYKSAFNRPAHFSSSVTDCAVFPFAALKACPKRMRSSRLSGEGELRGQPANPGSPGKMCVCVCVCALTLLVGRQEAHPACKELGVGLLVVMIWLELCTSYSSNCHHHLHHP